MAKTQRKDDFGDWLDFGGDVPWSSPGDSTDWASIDNPYAGLQVDNPPMDGGFSYPGNSMGGGLGSQDALGGILGGGGSFMSGLARLLGLTNSQGGASLAGIAGLLGPILGGATAYRATNNAANSLNAGIGNANAAAQGAFNAASGNFTPYQQAGTQALSQLSQQAPSNLAGQFGPLGSGRGLPISALGRR